MKKIFIIGLPRTGTTSACVALLDLGFKVAHSVNTMSSIKAADVIGDTPAYCDYKKLDRKFPGSKFIYLDRNMEQWLPSVKNLLYKMLPGLTAKTGGFHPTVIRCYKSTFKHLDYASASSDIHLASCYATHKSAIFSYFSGRCSDFLAINIGEMDSYNKMLSFLGVDSSNTSFPALNTNGQIVSWQLLRHPNKVPDSL